MRRAAEEARRRGRRRQAALRWSVKQVLLQSDARTTGPPFHGKELGARAAADRRPCFSKTAALGGARRRVDSAGSTTGPWPAILRCSPQKRAIRVSVIRGTGRPNGKRESALTSERSASERHAQQGCDGRAARTLQRSHGATECRKWGSSSRRNMEKGGPGARQAPRRTHSHCPRPRSTSGRAAG